ncbi:MAG: bifunctional methionine sulfoxide reductase B/A protein [Epsilonproteobacteria bacterium]|nr:bifunctional methionine sulfoxide reductase B/A protein [Campylobacterota bacterium]
MKEYKKLTPQEERVIVHKGTEMPFSGKYYDFYEDGIYLCKRCQTPLFRSKDKFNSGTGWPSFDDQIGDNVERVLDADGRRVEIICKNCKAHLGHVFENEGFTPKNTRHCVNSISLDFKSADELGAKKAYFAGGCFWGVEHYFDKLEGVYAAHSGYMGGRVENPSYEEVCTGNTGHLETVEVIYDPKKISFKDLTKLFFEIHDPTQTNGQGPDIGEQYLSAIFYNDEEEKNIALELIKEYEKRFNKKVATKLIPAKEHKFYKAEEYHQDYFKKRAIDPCHLKKKVWD